MPPRIFRTERYKATNSGVKHVDFRDFRVFDAVVRILRHEFGEATCVEYECVERIESAHLLGGRALNLDAYRGRQMWSWCVLVSWVSCGFLVFSCDLLRMSSFDRISILTRAAGWKLQGAHVGMFFKGVSMSGGRLEDG